MSILTQRKRFVLSINQALVHLWLLLCPGLLPIYAWSSRIYYEWFCKALLFLFIRHYSCIPTYIVCMPPFGVYHNNCTCLLIYYVKKTYFDPSTYFTTSSLVHTSGNIIIIVLFYRLQELCYFNTITNKRSCSASSNATFTCNVPATFTSSFECFSAESVDCVFQGSAPKQRTHQSTLPQNS